MDHEASRQRFIPNEVRLLLIGESPPSGGTFFYSGDSGLLRYTRKAFSSVYPRCPDSPSDFLAFFQQQGCFLDDLCHYPIDHLENRARRAAHHREVTGLAERISAFRPRSIACFVKGIEPAVHMAMVSAGCAHVPFVGLPFAGMGHQRNYVSGLVSFINQLVLSGILATEGAA
jgi:hypothetical protein